MIAALAVALTLALHTAPQSTTVSTAGDTARHVAASSTTVTIATTTGDTARHAAGKVDSATAATAVVPIAVDSVHRVPTLPAVKLPSALIAPSPLPAWLLYALVGSLLFLVLFFAHGMFRTRAIPPGQVAAARFAVWLVHPFTGTDGRLSFSKLICVGVLVHYAISANMPAVVACWIIAASFGTKVLLAVVDKTGLSVSSATSLAGSFARTESDAETRSASTSDSKSDTRVVSEQITRNIQEERGPTGEPPRSLPPANATTPDGAR